MAAVPLSVLVVDDELPAREELGYLLSLDSRVGVVHQSGSGTEALRLLDDTDIDVVFLDIAMPGLSGIELARVLNHYKRPPAVVFVTAHDEHAVSAFEVHAIDYLLKPVRGDRVGEAVRRVVEGGGHGLAAPEPDETLPVELGGVTRFIQRSDVRYAETHGDYARLHTADASHLVRIPMSDLEARWRSAGFVRTHRQYLVSLAHIDEVRQDGGHVHVVVSGHVLPVSRRHARDLRELLFRRFRSEPIDGETADGGRA